MSEVEDRSSGLGNANPDESATAKKERTPAQIESLARARQKAAEVRAKNTALRRKERELVNAQLAETRRLREETIEREHAERFHPKDTQSDEAPVTSQEEETGKEVVYQKKPQKRRVVVVQQQSSATGLDTRPIETDNRILVIIPIPILLLGERQVNAILFKIPKTCILHRTVVMFDGAVKLRPKRPIQEPKLVWIGIPLDVCWLGPSN